MWKHNSSWKHGIIVGKSQKLRDYTVISDEDGWEALCLNSGRYCWTIGFDSKSLAPSKKDYPQWSKVYLDFIQNGQIINW